MIDLVPYYDLCPKDPAENLQWRLKWMELAEKDEGLQRDLRQAAFEDILFWFSGFCWCFEPRSAIKIKAFVPWVHQPPAMVAMDNAISDSERHFDETGEPMDLVVDKSRGQGATWMYLMILLRRWLRDDMFSAGLVTRNESLVDSPRDPDTLMWKVVWAVNRLPFWMRPKGLDYSKHRNLTEHSLINPANGATIVGYAATGDVARGGRKSIFCMDELAAFKTGEDYAALNSTQHVTSCRFLVSTFLGDSGAYYDAATKEGSAIKIVLDWRDNPTQNGFLYEYVNGKTVFLGNQNPSQGIVDLISEQHEKLRRRGYVIEGKVRSPWYNSQCLRPGATPRGIAQELDRDPHGSVAKVFSSVVIKDTESRCVIPPLMQGTFVFNVESAEPMEPFISNQSESGELKLWCKPNFLGEMPQGRYILGADISAGGGGTYTSNSVAHVVNAMTGEQMAEWASHRTDPGRFARVCVSLCRWFNSALLIPEINFCGNFLKVIIDELAYQNLYYREIDVEGLHKKTEKPGFWMGNDDAKLKIFMNMQEAMAIESFTPRSENFLKECLEYEWRNGKIVHVPSASSDDEAAKGRAHGDRVIAASLAWLGVSDEPEMGDEKDGDVDVPDGSMAARLKEYDYNTKSNILDEDIDTWELKTVFSGKDPWR